MKRRSTLAKTSRQQIVWPRKWQTPVAAARCASSPGAGEPVSMLLRADAPDVRSAERGLVVLINTGRAAELPPPLDPLPPAAGAPFNEARPIEDGERDALLGPGEVKILAVTATMPVADRSAGPTTCIRGIALISAMSSII